MTSPVSSAQNPQVTSAAAPKAPPTPPKAPPAPPKAPPQDTVQLSSKASSGDVDHDGDSH
jgi:hypothetical protein